MKIKQILFISVLLLLAATGGRAQDTAAYEYDEISGWMRVTSSGTVDFSTVTKPVTAIEITSSASSKGVTFNNLTGKYVGVGAGTLLNPYGGTLQSGLGYKAVETYVLKANINAGTYTIDASGLGTLCFPNTVSLEGLDVQALKAVRVDDDVLVLEDITDSYRRIPAYTPVILYKRGGGNVPLGNTSEVSQAPIVISQNSNLLVGINNNMTVEPENGHVHYLMQTHDGVTGFYPAINSQGNPRSFNATRYRCFLNLQTSPSLAKALRFTIPAPKPSGIGAIEADAAPVKDGFYTLNGQVVTKPVPGKVYIMCLDGRATKVLIR